MRKLLYIEEREKVNKDELKNLVNKIVDALVDYLDEYRPKSESYTKHSLMGPVGKLLSILESGRIENRDAILGYVINVHKNTSASGFISDTAIEKLNMALDLLIELRNKTSVRLWIKLLREIDYAVYKRKFEKIIKSKK